MSAHREEYMALRAEICQSIHQQHQILLGGYGASAAALGLIFGSDADNPIGGKALFVVPVILTAMVALWAVECNRMVRASFYIATELWDRIRNDESKDEGWETWIRRSEGIEGRFRKRQHHLQRIVTLYLPCGLTAVGFLLSLKSTWTDLAWFLPILALALLVSVIWGYLFLEIPKISDLGSEWTHKETDCIESTNNPMDRRE
jgi:heme/copper-type cytochrome/quinol oxidase subunit 4